MSSQYDFEHELLWRGRAFAITTLDDARVEPRRSDSFPAALVAYAERAEELGCLPDEDLAGMCSDEDARQLTSRLWERARELVAAGRLTIELPADAGQFARTAPPYRIVEVIGAVVRAHMEYDVAAERRALSESRWAKLRTVARTVWRLRRGRPVRLAEQATGRGTTKGVCLDFAVVMRTLFYALKRATGALRDVFVVEVSGEAFRVRAAMHAWNWLIDARTASLVAFDASQTRGQVRPLVINLARYNNVSGFLATAIIGAVRDNDVDRDNVIQLLGASIDPTSERGQVLMFGIADHVGMSLRMRNRIASHLAARRFERVMPDWRTLLTERTASLGDVGRRIYAELPGDLQLLAGLGLATS